MKGLALRLDVDIPIRRGLHGGNQGFAGLVSLDTPETVSRNVRGHLSVPSNASPTAADHPGGATESRPTTLCFSIRRATSPDDFASSTKSCRKAALAALVRAVPTAC